jgi:hypothetical protein
MRSRGPIVTLLVVVVLAAVLLAINLSKRSSGDTAAQATAPATSTAPAAPPAAAAPPGTAAPGAAAPGAAPEAGAAPGAGAPPAPGAAAEPFPAQAKYTGHTDGIKAAIAVTVRGDKVSAYLCDGKSIEGWYQGTASGGSLRAKGRGTNALDQGLERPGHRPVQRGWHGAPGAPARSRHRHGGRGRRRGRRPVARASQAATEESSR